MSVGPDAQNIVHKVELSNWLFGLFDENANPVDHGVSAMLAWFAAFSSKPVTFVRRVSEKKQHFSVPHQIFQFLKDTKPLGR